jgi:hypothetical protein
MDVLGGRVMLSPIPNGCSRIVLEIGPPLASCSGSAGLREEQKFAVPSARATATLSAPNGRNRGAQTAESKAGKRGQNGIEHGGGDLIVEAAIVQVLTPLRGIELIVGFDERNDSPRRGEPLPCDWQGVPLRGPAQINGDQINASDRRLGVHGIGSLANFNAVILAKRPRQDAISGVNGNDRGGACSQQTIGKPADIAAKIGAGEAGWVNAEYV